MLHLLHREAQAGLEHLGLNLRDQEFAYLPPDRSVPVEWRFFWEALQTFMPLAQAENLLKTLAAILHLGNGTQASTAMAEKLLQIPDGLLAEAIRVCRMRGSRNESQQRVARDTVAQALYNGVFKVYSRDRCS